MNDGTANVAANGTGTKLQLRPDGTVFVPVKGQAGFVLEEPSMRQLAEIHTLLAGADASLPPLPTLQGLGENPTPDEERIFREELREYSRVAQERANMMYGDAETAPYGQAFISIVKMLTGAELTVDDLYGWAMNWQTGRQMLNHFTDPLGGAVDAPTA